LDRPASLPCSFPSQPAPRCNLRNMTVARCPPLATTPSRADQRQCPSPNYRNQSGAAPAFEQTISLLMTPSSMEPQSTWTAWGVEAACGAACG
jgi:hypothetical protein